MNNAKTFRHLLQVIHVVDYDKQAWSMQGLPNSLRFCSFKVFTAYRLEVMIFKLKAHEKIESKQMHTNILPFLSANNSSTFE